MLNRVTFSWGEYFISQWYHLPIYSSGFTYQIPNIEHHMSACTEAEIQSERDYMIWLCTVCSHLPITISHFSPMWPCVCL